MLYTKAMKRVALFGAIVTVGVGVALTYYVFEAAVAHAIQLIWYDWLDTDTNRWLVIPLIFILTYIFFSLTHYLDPAGESGSHALGKMPKPSVANFVKVLLIGFCSLVAGAALGPEAILVPASMVLGSYIGHRLFTKSTFAVSFLAGMAMVALFTAFFHSVVVGMLSVALIRKQTKTRLMPLVILASLVAATSSYFTLKIVEAESYVSFPHYSWSINLRTILLAGVLIAAGYGAIIVMSKLHKIFSKVTQHRLMTMWWLRAFVASVGLIALYLLGGPLVEFTGNKSILPLLDQAADLGLWGLLWVLGVKIAAISWSKTIGYRGGMIFPTIFLAAGLTAIIQLYASEFNFIYGIIAVLVGAFIANRKTGILA